jgi:L-galactose dehydrogenase
MEYRKLGTTGLEVSAISYGASPLGGVFGAIDASEGVRAVREALDGGINLIDVSPYYGLTRAESVLGEALKGVPRDSYLLATKVGRYGDGDFDFSPDRVTRSVDESLARLGVEFVDLIQCHDIEFVPLQPIVNDTLPALRKIQEQGKTRFVGVTGFSLSALRTVAQQAPVDTVLSYCNYSLNNTRLEGELPFYAGRGVGVINASPFSMGLLTQRGAPPWHPAGDEIAHACQRAAQRCASQNVDIAQIALQFAVAHSGIATTLVGMASPEEVRQNLAWASEPFEPALLHEIQDVLSPIHNLVWPTGLAENA